MRWKMALNVIAISTILIAGGCHESHAPESTSGTIVERHLAATAIAQPGPKVSGEAAKNMAPMQNNAALDAVKIAGEGAKPKPLRILVIGAHPADVFDQSGGTMAHHIQRGDWVGCAILTHGARIHDEVVSNDMFHRQKIPETEELNKIIAERTDVKSKEVLLACSILGVPEQDVYFLGADDAVLLVNKPMIRQLARLIRKLRPNVIITHFPLEDANVGSQHATTGRMVMHAVPLAAGVDPGDKNPPHKITQVFFFGLGVRSHLWGAQGGFYNDVYIDITDMAAKKVACLDAIKSQGYGDVYARKRIETSDGAFGAGGNVAYAEGFISLYSTTHKYLPVSEINLEHSKASDHETMIRYSHRVSIPSE